MKEKLYKTAQIKATINHVPMGLSKGQFVAVKHYGRIYNAMTGAHENLYLVSADSEFHIESPIMHEESLERFVL